LRQIQSRTGGRGKDRALLESFDEDPANLEPAPVASKLDAGSDAQCVAGRGTIDGSASQVTIYIYEAWSLRFAIARVSCRTDVVVGAWLMVENQVAAADRPRVAKFGWRC